MSAPERAAPVPPVSAPKAACAPASDSCLRCQVVPGSSRRSVVLAAMDGDAEAALAMRLAEAGVTYSSRGRLLYVEFDGAPGVDQLLRLREAVPDSLSGSVKGVIIDSGADAEEALFALVRAEPLDRLFSQADAEWVRPVLEDGSLFSVFHPILDGADGSVFGYEALIRARGGVAGGEVKGAGPLLDACERLNLQHQLDQRARIAAIRGGAALPLNGARLFINFLPNAIYDPEICLRTTIAAADEAGIPLGQIVFEVTETERIPSMERLRAIVDYYRRKGAAVALDDISSGFASLQILADLAPDYVKIDRELVQSAPERAGSRHTLASIVSLAKKLGCRVIAEGIETPEQRAACVEEGVDYLQGFLFGRPALRPEVVWPS